MINNNTKIGGHTNSAFSVVNNTHVIQKNKKKEAFAFIKNLFRPRILPEIKNR